MPELHLSPTDAPDVDPLDAMLADGNSLTPDKPATPAGEIIVNGELIPRHDVGAIAAALRWVDRVKEQYHLILACEAQLREAAGELATGPQKTQRLVGENGETLKVEFPSDGWDDAKLLAAWHEEQFATWKDRCLKISKVKVVWKEWQKLLTIDQPPKELAAFITALKAAVKPALGLPTVKIESAAIDVEPMPESPAELELSQLD